MNAASAEAHAAESEGRGRTLLDRALVALPVVGLGLLVLSFYFVEAWTRKTPWDFTDELEWSQLSRAIATTGHAARRDEPISFKSLYAYLIAPMWWIHSTHAAYSAIKYLNAFVMSLAAVPTYLLARMLVTRRAAIAVALLAVAIPGMSYAASIIPEPLAYPWFALCSWLVVRALATRRPRHVALAVAVCVVAVEVRAELAMVLPAFAIAAAGLWVTGPQGRALRTGWTRTDYLGALVLLVGALLLFNRAVLDHVHTWQIASGQLKSRMVDLGLRAVAALAIGLGLLPVVAGLASLRLPERRGQPAYRAFAAFLASSILCFVLYTAGKAAYNSTVFSTLTEERNLIYLSPLLLVGTAVVFEARRLNWWLVGIAAAFVLYIVLTKPLDFAFYPYFEAPGFAILSVANRQLDFTLSDLHRALVVALVIGLAALAARRYRAVAAAAAVLLLAWMLAGEIGATDANDGLANHLIDVAFLGQPAAPLDGIDRLTHGGHVTVLGQSLSQNANKLWLAEFWNRSIHHVDGLYSQAPGPGPTGAPGLLSTDGVLSQDTGDPYVLVDAGLTLQAPVVGSWAGLTLYRVTGVWRLREAVQDVSPDGWSGGRSAYTYFARGGPGMLVVDLSRTGYRGDTPAAHALVRVGTVGIDDQQAPVIERLLATRHTIVPNGGRTVVRIPVARTPVRVEVTIPLADLFQPGPGDLRLLGAQVSFRFDRTKKA